MNKCLVACSIDNICYKREIIENKIVNLNLCKNISKSNYAWYPDNEGKPSIKFNGCEVEWVYQNIKDRDSDYNKLIDVKL